MSRDRLALEAELASERARADAAEKRAERALAHETEALAERGRERADRDREHAARVKAEGEAAAMRAVIVVRDPDSGGWECMNCNRTAAYNDREGLEHTADCPLAPDAGRALLAELAELRGKVAALETALRNRRSDIETALEQWPNNTGAAQVILRAQLDFIDRALSPSIATAPGGKDGGGK